MRIESTRGGWRLSVGRALHAALVIVVIGAGGTSPSGAAGASVPSGAVLAQGTSDDPCRFYTADAMGKAFGRPMKSSRLVDVCDYRGSGTDRVVVKVGSGPEGTILRHARSASARRGSGAEKVATTVGEAYFDGVLPVFVGRVGNHEVQIETTIQPVPRDAMIAVGGRIMQSLSRR